MNITISTIGLPLNSSSAVDFFVELLLPYKQLAQAVVTRSSEFRIQRSSQVTDLQVIRSYDQK